MRASSTASTSAMATSRALEQHEQMIEEIGGLAFSARASLADAGDDGLDRLLAELLGAALGAGIEQLAGIGLGRRGMPSRRDDRCRLR